MRKIVNYLYIIALLLTFVGCTSCEGGNGPDNNKPDEKETKDVSTYVTTGDKTMLFSAVSKSFGTGINMNIEKTLTLKPEQIFQTIDGFGAAITGSSCYNLLKMSKEDRVKLLEESFSPDKGMGYSYIRVSIGCSDFSLDEYTCCDEPGIENFAMHPYDVRDIYPILREILAINPKIKIMGSPWTPPRWMKVNNLTDLQPYNSWTSGQLNPKYYQDYATYFVKWIQAMEKEGFPIESITIQNEPLNRGNSVSLYMTWQEQRDFIKTALGPKFAEANLKTKIIVFDHNFNYDNISDQQDYPLKIYEDPEAAKYIDGAAYHAYGGSSSEFTKIHNARPDKNLYFTEMSIGTWNYHSFEGDLMWTMKEIGIGALNRHCKAVIVWNYMLDDNRGPNRPGGCTTCYGAVDINSSDYKTLDRKSHYYFIGHMSKVLLPGSLRIGTSGLPSGVYATAALNPDGTYGIVLQNENATSFQMTIEDENHHFDITLPGKSLTSCTWKR